MKKGAIIILILILYLSLVVADNNSTGIDLAYECLENKVTDTCADLSEEAQAFALLALSYDSDLQTECKDALLANINTNNCWPKNSCKLKETALATLALYNINQDTEDYETWLLSQNHTATDLTWYLQTDASSETNCQFSYNDRTYTAIIGEDKKINTGAGSCLTLAMDNYWFKIAQSCIDKDFTISCDKDFITNLLYTKSGSSTVYVSSDTHSSSASGSTTEKINAQCFKQNSVCDYEGTLWAVTALQKTGHNIRPFLPYLIAFAPQNEKYGANAFLFLLEDKDTYFQALVTKQNIAGYWKFLATPYNQFYDTSVALLSLYGQSSEQAEEAKQWLLDNQLDSGCWSNNDVRDTSFILYSGWPRDPTTSDSGPAALDYCTDYNNYCISQGECDNAGGNTLDNYFCPGLDVCCDTPYQDQTCLEKSGIICPTGETCSIYSVTASDTTACCLSTCIVQPTQTECVQNGYTCKSSCDTDESEESYSCNGVDVCCKYNPTPPQEPGSYWWIWLLVILIILVVLGIIFRKKLQVWIFAMKSKFKKAPSKPAGGRMLPPGMRPMPRFMPPHPPIRRAPPQAAPPAKSQSPKDKEFEATLKKLKEMGK